jgi:hypothetical protein
MVSSSKLAGLFLMVCAPLAAVACVVDSGPDSRPYDDSSGGGPAGSATSDGSPSAHPMTAIIDTDQTMQVNPGQGVGVFVEYDTGGNWNVWWTCDTSIDSSNPACAFDVKVTAESGAITNLASSKFASGDVLTQADPGSWEATTTTSTGSDTVTFTTTPGARILLDATIGGQHDGQFIFFVQGGKVNDGFKNPVTDPIYMHGSEP